MNGRQKNVSRFCNGVLTSRQIATLSNDSQKYVQDVMLKFDLPRRTQGSAFGELNGSYKTGRRIDRDGYVIVSAPPGHPLSRIRANRNTGIMLEHRKVMEEKLGRFLLRSEIVDHIDGLTLHNDPLNLRLFENNGEHLAMTTTGKKHSISVSGKENLLGKNARTTLSPVDRYGQMKRLGDARLLQILRAWLILDTSSPYLLGTLHHLKKAGISDLSRSNLTRELGFLCQKWELTHSLSISV